MTTEEQAWQQQQRRPTGCQPTAAAPAPMFVFLLNEENYLSNEGGY